MNLIVFLSLFLPAFGLATCPPDTAPQTLDLANKKMVSQLRAALNRPAPREENTCQKDLKEKRSELLKWVGLLAQNISHMAASEEKWASEILAKKIPMDAAPETACRHQRDLEELLDLYERANARSEYFYGKLNSVANVLQITRAENRIFAEPAKAKLLIQCRDEFRERSMDFEDEDDEDATEDDRREICLQRAGAGAELWDAVKLMERKSGGAAAGLACALDPKSNKQVKANLEIAKTIETRAKTMISQTSAYFDGLSERIPARIPQISAAQAALASRNCQGWLRAESRKVEAATRKLLASDGHGSGFVLAGKNGQPELISARHVGFRDESFTASPLKITGSQAEKQARRGIEFEVKPGSYDRGRDLVKRSLSSAGASLVAAPAGSVSLPGEKVRIYGYPAIREGKFTSLGCETQGIGRNEVDHPNSESYLLFCPGAESHVGGMSGGPALNAKGEVIGIVSAHNPLTNMVVVQPLSRSAEGENLFGFRDIFLYDHCFNGTDMSAKPRRCQIIPGLTFQKTGY